MVLGSLEIKKIIEALLFVTKKPLSVDELSKLTDEPKDQVEGAVSALMMEYEGRGLKIFTVAHGFIMGTDHSCADYVDRLVHSKIETTLTPQALETLAIIAYKQPITKLDIEKIRGVYSDGVLETLQAKKLIEEKGRSKALGRPILYGTTTEFLRHFGLKDLLNLPVLPDREAEQQDIFRTALG